MDTERVTDYLERDHAQLHDWIERARTAATFDMELYVKFRAGLLRHISIEEKLLFPAVRRAQGGAMLPWQHELRIDHAALTSLLVPTPDAALCGELLSILGPHDAKEEGTDGVYAACEAALTPETSRALAIEAAAYPQIKMNRHFDGPLAHRTAAAALASAARMKRPAEAEKSS